MCGTDTAGRGALEPPPEDGAETNLFGREFRFRESHAPPTCRRYLRHDVAQTNGFEPIYIKLTCRPSTRKMRNISTATNAIISYKKDELERSTINTGITRVLLDVSCSSCGPSNLLAWHSSQLLATSRLLFVQALQTSRKTTAIWLLTCIVGRAKNPGLLGQSLLTKQLFTRSQFGWSFASCTLSRDFFICL